MKTTPKALKDLFVALGGDPSAVDGLLTVDVLNAIAEKYEGEGDATRIPDAIDAITAVADNIGGGGGDQPAVTKINVLNKTANLIDVDGFGSNLSPHTWTSLAANNQITSHFASNNLKNAVPIVVTFTSGGSVANFRATSAGNLVSCLYSTSGNEMAVMITQDNHVGDTIEITIKNPAE